MSVLTIITFARPHIPLVFDMTICQTKPYYCAIWPDKMSKDRLLSLHSVLHSILCSSTCKMAGLCARY